MISVALATHKKPVKIICSGGGIAGPLPPSAKGGGSAKSQAEKSFHRNSSCSRFCCFTLRSNSHL